MWPDPIGPSSKSSAYSSFSFPLAVKARLSQGQPSGRSIGIPTRTYTSYYRSRRTYLYPVQPMNNRSFSPISHYLVRLYIDLHKLFYYPPKWSNRCFIYQIFRWIRDSKERQIFWNIPWCSARYSSLKIVKNFFKVEKLRGGISVKCSI